MNKFIGVTAFALIIAGLGVAGADVSPAVQKAFRGRILVTDNGLPDARATDAATVAAIEKANKKELQSTNNSEDVAEWQISYTAFLKTAPKVSALSFDFYTDDKEKLYVANKGLMGLDPTLTILSGVLTINEDDGLVRGRTYVVKLTGKVKKREVVFAQTKLTMK